MVARQPFERQLDPESTVPATHEPHADAEPTQVAHGDSQDAQTVPLTYVPAGHDDTHVWLLSKK